ncbi:SDR family oxidoreductase [Sediminibacterium ginsengisoli]|uniref:NAD(P)-dependent dehydrogenase, short-chain alcohol dehydrogenase family n=1 Tax=Sediminibacterium ginsengisoli TaxID=413434 RepID=A0A1T4RK10_9BACT|nr:SDR family oxidoreductase [Sediminibacterium ginsengisoli]SKA16350.1 NAD(P)-dependent dehydrogenase, short-chain alcohol dehydrogenase family [Sediminibacterium ginsengisoli]
MQNLQGKTALITGGNSGIGYAAAKELVANGAKVIITGRRKEAVEKAAAELGAVAMIADQSKMADIETLSATVATQYGKIDILVVNAGISKLTMIENATEELFDEVMDLNVKGAYFTLSRLIPVLNDGASVVLISSSSASKSIPQTSVYAASKVAINAVMKIAAVELAPRRIRVNAVSPGPFATEIMEKAGLNDPKTQEFIKSGVPLGRLGIPAEAGKLISFLAGDDAAYITGAEYLVDGGQSLNR